MRQIRLKNAKGQLFDLTAPGIAFLHDISGFGFSVDAEYENIGSQYIPIERELEQMKPSGVIEFAGYEIYREFILFIQKRPLVLEYEIAAITYYLDVAIKKIDKGELNNLARLECPIIFESLGRMYKKVIRKINTQMTAGKAYLYEYPYTYSSETSGCVIIESDSTLDSPATLTFIGPCINPTWTHYVDGERCCNGRVNCEIPQGHRLIVSTYGLYKIVEEDSFGQEIEDRYKDSDFSTERFVTLSQGENKISFVHDGTNALDVIVEGMICYESV